jgi:hypothetical protein
VVAVPVHKLNTSNIHLKLFFSKYSNELICPSIKSKTWI